ncbi:class I SAM-dependent methyltransferase [Paenibacillus sp. HB172176]|uniref:class I SAM-dependent methyltransferase n=1 Tax=Paenibacillus sp. HB172176 TaxID=2493690 RepID=UPI001439A0EE|nr:class I SAM-dependent methyltransferase [Paenibacillus sp. HB172176]
MKQNKYDDNAFFEAYGQMARSVQGLEGAGEWHAFKALLPELQDKRVLDLGCGYGWHCRYALEQGAGSVVGVDISERMLQQARSMTDDPRVKYIQHAIEDLELHSESFDVAISSLAFHYIASFGDICRKVFKLLKPGGEFVFSVEHPVFTARSEQDWHYGEQGERAHWPIDHYQEEGLRDTSFLAEHVIKYHRTLSTYLNELIGSGFTLKAVNEPLPAEELLLRHPEMSDELRRPMFLILAAVKSS